MKALAIRVSGEGAEPVSGPGCGATPSRGRCYTQMVRGRRGVESGAWSGWGSRTRETYAVHAVGAALIDDFTGRPDIRGRGRRLLWQIVRIFGRVRR